MSYVHEQKWEPLISSCLKPQNLTLDGVYEQLNQKVRDHFLS